MAELALAVARLDFADVPGFGERSMFARLTGGRHEALGYPLLTSEGRERVSSSPFQDCAAAAELLGRMNASLPPPSPEARYVVGGQQCALLLGPLYAFLKAVTAVSLARRVSEETGARVEPLFWMASEDHDVLEVNRVTVNGRRFVHDYGGELARGKVPQVADIDASKAKGPVIEFLREALHETEFTPWLMGIVEGADWSTYSTAFAGIMHSLFDEWGLRIVDPVALRELSGAPLAHLVSRWADVVAAMESGRAGLAARGVEAPLSSAGVFEIAGGARVAVEFSADGLSAATSRGEVTLEELAEEIRLHPGSFSPSAALRPVLQDAVLPVVATFGGPSEMAYLWQVEPVYDVLDATPSLRTPRISATFVEENILRAARKAGLSLEGVFDAAKLLDKPPDADGASAGAGVEEAGARLVAAIDALVAERGGESAPKWLSKGRESISRSVERIAERLRQEALEAEGRGRSRIEKIAAAVLPGGKPQERVESVMRFLSLHGPAFVRRCIEELDPGAGCHLVVEVSAREGGEDRNGS